MEPTLSHTSPWTQPSLEDAPSTPEWDLLWTRGHCVSGCPFMLVTWQMNPRDLPFLFFFSSLDCQVQLQPCPHSSRHLSHTRCCLLATGSPASILQLRSCVTVSGRFSPSQQSGLSGAWASIFPPACSGVLWPAGRGLEREDQG